MTIKLDKSKLLGFKLIDQAAAAAIDDKIGKSSTIAAIGDKVGKGLTNAVIGDKVGKATD